MTRFGVGLASCLFMACAASSDEEPTGGGETGTSGGSTSSEGVTGSSGGADGSTSAAASSGGEASESSSTTGESSPENTDACDGVTLRAKPNDTALRGPSPV